jgi:predicted metal-dependent hydrolase
VAAELKELADAAGSLSYELRRTHRLRTVAITVEPDRRVVVLAPIGAQGARIDEILRRRLPWIRRQRRTLEMLPPPPLPRQWVPGETHRYLGRQYRLKVLKGFVPGVKLLGSYFVVTLRDPENRRGIQRLMDGWYRERATNLIRERVTRLLRATTWLEVEAVPPITIRAMRLRWGSTTAGGRVNVNIDAVKLPLGCLDYVLAHELVHLRIRNHGPAFWRMLTRVQPDWKRWRDRLARVEV